jgi:hypothetical protein
VSTEPRFWKVVLTVTKDGQPHGKRARYVKGLDELNELMTSYALNPDFMRADIEAISEAEYVRYTHPRY